jgi:hypothetical protein
VTAVRYLLCPGPVWSRSDGDWHHVTAGQLADLYGVPMPACLVLRKPEPGDRAGARSHDALLGRVAAGDLIALRPRSDGAYALPSPTL